MDWSWGKYKGIHPGIVLERELKKRALKKRPFALAIGEFPQTITAITKGKRKVTIEQGLKIDHFLGLEEGTMAMLQTWYDIKQAKHAIQETPNINNLRKSLFWDTDIRNIDWQKQAPAVIERVYERGNAKEKQEILRFYGEQKVRLVLRNTKRKPYTVYQNK